MAEPKVDLIEIQVYLDTPVTFDEAVTTANRIRDMIAIAGEDRPRWGGQRWTVQIVDIRGGEEDEGDRG